MSLCSYCTLLDLNFCLIIFFLKKFVLKALSVTLADQILKFKQYYNGVKEEEEKEKDFIIR